MKGSTFFSSLMVRHTAIVALLLASFFSACKPDAEVPDEVLPADEDPAITLLTPSNSQLLKRSGEQAVFTFRLADNEALKLFRAVPRIYNAEDSLIGDALPIDFQISGENITYDFTVTVPSLDPYYKIRYTCYVIDSKGASASTYCWVNVLPDPEDPPVYQVLSYTNDSIFNVRSNKEYGFNFNSRRRIPATTGQNLDTLRLQMDIAENSFSGQGGASSWVPFLISPANQQLGLDSVFVITDASRFNYEDATYETIYQAFYSDPSPAVRTPVLKVGDYVIVRLIRSPRPQFAVMKITFLKSDGAGVNVRDYFKFDYKVTTP
ncbi:MAG: hypothetical protein EAZ89_02430 [Bacteroidetes bacterium]|nr:MAG: hypothetical protein EAZ89_02430 [Bacteroidota bacterium]